MLMYLIMVDKTLQYILFFVTVSYTVVYSKQSSQVIGHAGNMWNYSAKWILFVASLPAMLFDATNSDPSCISFSYQLT